MRVGLISYINSFPLTFALRNSLAPSKDQLVWGVPKELNEQFMAGELDLVQGSSFLYYEKNYPRLQNFGIASRGAVGSVLYCLTAGVDPGEGSVYVSKQTDTSKRVLQYLYPDLVVTSDKEGADSFLWIGDEALGLDHSRYHQVLDLGALWFLKTGLPLVYSTWCFHQEVDSSELQRWNITLEDAYKWGQDHPEEYLQEAQRRTGLPQQKLEHYYRNLEFQLSLKHDEGLKLLRQLQKD